MDPSPTAPLQWRQPSLDADLHGTDEIRPFSHAETDVETDATKRLPSRHLSTWGGLQRLGVRSVGRLQVFMATIMVLLQLLWSLSVPIKNATFIPWPTVFEDTTSVQVDTKGYPGMPPTDADIVLNGEQVMAILRRTLRTVLESPTITSQLMYTQSFSVDTLSDGLTNDQYEALNDYVMLIHQVSEFPGGAFVGQHEETIDVVGDAAGGDNSARRSITYSCPASDAKLMGAVCTNGNNEPCKFTAGEVQTFETVSLETLRTKTSLENHFALLVLIERFHQIMMSFFRTQQWATTVIEFTDKTFDVQSDKLVVSKSVPAFGHDATVVGANTTVESCVSTELMLGGVFGTHFMLDLIQSELLRTKIPQASDFYKPSALANGRVKSILSKMSMRITSGVQCRKRETKIDKMFERVMTIVETSTCYKKLSRTLTPSPVLGSPLGMLQALFVDTSSGYRVTTTKSGSSVRLQHHLLGAYRSNMVSFKNDRTLMSSRMWKLRERTQAQIAAEHPIHRMYEIDEWMAPYMSRADGKTNNLVRLVDSHLETSAVVNNKLETLAPECSGGMLYTLAQIAYVAMLRRNPLMFHLGWSSMVGGGDPSSTARNQLTVYQVITENSLGARNMLKYSSEQPREALWVMLPLLEQHRHELGDAGLVSMVLAELNNSFPRVVLLESPFVMFTTTQRCIINVEKHNLTKTDTMAELYEKQFPTYRDVVTDLVAVLPKIVADMDSEFGKIRIASQYITGTPTYPLGTAKLEGPPVAFERNVLTYGLVRLTTEGIPTKEFMLELSKTEQCYDAIDLRYLNSTIRCFQEDLTRVESIVRKNAEGLRTFLYSNWSIGMVLNALSMWLVLLHVKRILHVAMRTRFKDLTLWHAFHVHLQGPNLLSFPQLVLISASAIPLLVGCHLPFDVAFMTADGDIVAGLSEVLVALCLTWFIRVGVEAGARVVNLSSPSPVSYIMLSRFRNLMLIPIMFIRTGMADATYQQGIVKLIVSSVISIVFGFGGIVLARLWPVNAARPNDWIGQALRQVRASRSVYGTLSFSPFSGWSICAFMIEGWALRTVNGKPVLVRGDRFALELPDSSDPEKSAVYSLPQMSDEKLRSHPIVNASKDTAEDEMGHVRRAFFVTATGGGVSNRMYRFCLFLIFAQTIWTLVTPIINVVLLPYPAFLTDGITIKQSAYTGANDDTTVFTGSEVLEILNRTLQITLDNPQVFQTLASARRFAFDTISPALSSEEYAVITNFTVLYAQTTMFPPTQFVPRRETFFFPNDAVPSRPFLDNVTYVCRPEFETLHGQRCVNGDGEVCAFSKTETGRVWSFVNFTDTYRSAGVTHLNTFALNEAVNIFYDLLNFLFGLGSWKEFRHEMQWRKGENTYLGEANDTLLNTQEYTDMFRQMTNVTDKTVYTCWGSEQLLMGRHIPQYLFQMLQSELLKRPAARVFFNVTEDYHIYSIADKRMDLIRSRKLHVTSGVRMTSDVSSIKRLGSTTLTRWQSANVSKKFTPSRLFGGEPGYPSRMIEYMKYYPDLYSYFDKAQLSPTEGQSEMMVAGSQFSGFNTFRGDWWGMTHRHFLLRERSLNQEPRLMSNTIDQDEAIMAWFGRAQDRSIGLQSIVASHLDATSENTDCHAALLFTIAQVTWLMALTDAPILTSLVFFATMNGARDTAPWYLQQMSKMEVMGQTSLGQMRPIQYTDPSNDPRAAWPIVPLLSIFRNIYGESDVATKFLTKLNSTFPVLVGAKDGKLDLNIKANCPIGVNKYNIQSQDSLGTIYAKLYPAFAAIIADLLAATPAIHDAMLKEVSSSLYVRRELITGTNAFRKPLVTWEGPSVFTVQTPLSIGLMKLSTKNVPQQRDVRKLLLNEHCYDALELRYLNVTVRCFFEDGSFTETLLLKESGRLRMMMSILWALAAVLNVFSAYVALSLTRKVWRTYQRTRFRDVNLYLALDVNIHGPSMLGLNDVLLMTAACIPLLVGYYLPPNKEFIDSSSKPKPALREFLVVASLLWFVRLGAEVVAMEAHQETQNFRSIRLQQRARYALLLLVLAVRPFVEIGDGAYNRGLLVLVVTVVLVIIASLFIGFIGTAYVRIRGNGRRLAPAPEGGSKVDVMEEAFKRLRLNRLQHGTLGHTPMGWTLSGLLLEGWRPAEKADELVLTCDDHLAALHLKPGSLVPVDQRPPVGSIDSMSRRIAPRGSSNSVAWSEPPRNEVVPASKVHVRGQNDKVW